jgi:hypothetical protein
MPKVNIVSIASCYWLDGPEIKCSFGKDYSYPSKLVLGPTEPHILVIPRVKQPGRGVNHPPPSSTEVKREVELYLYAPSGPSSLF